MEDCQPCPFGTSSKAGAETTFDCVPVAQKCPPGQIAAPDAESREQCGCLPGYGGAYVRPAQWQTLRHYASAQLPTPLSAPTILILPPIVETRRCFITLLTAFWMHRVAAAVTPATADAPGTRCDHHPAFVLLLLLLSCRR
jgi:hypothetical protein